MEVTDKSQASPSLPLKTRILFSLLSLATTATRRRDGTVNRRLFNLLDIKAPPNPNPINGITTYDVTVDPSRNLWFRVFNPTQFTGNLPVIVFFHGGGFVYLSPNSRSYDAVCRRFAVAVEAIVVSVNYRLAPEHRYPAQYDDGLDVLKFLDVNSHEALPGNADMSCCFVAGDSAGGNLAHHVAKRSCEFKFGQLQVIGLVAIQPFFGGEERTESEKRLVGSIGLSVRQTDWYWTSFLPAGEQIMGRDHEAINVSGPRAADISGLEFPATILFVGGFDLLQDWQRRYYEWLKRSGKQVNLVEYPSMIHGFYAFPEFPESTQLISEVSDFVHKQSSVVVKAS